MKNKSGEMNDKSGEMNNKKQKMFREKLAPAAFGSSVGKLGSEPMGTQILASSSQSPDPPRIPMDLQREADRLLLARYVPPAVLVNHHLEIIQTRGRTAPFLEFPPGKASLNLLKMARPGLLFGLQNAIDEARTTGFEAMRRDVRVHEDGKNKTVTVRVVPLRVPTQEHYSFLIIFEATGAPEAVEVRNSAVMPDPIVDDHAAPGRQVVQLRQELAATREHLQSIIESQEGSHEELQSANEEIKSGNEELQSTNEELQTSKEELESANEELHTANEDMQHRNDLLSQLNNDLTNLLYSVSLPIVMLGADLCVRRFTPQAATALGLTANDIGQPMSRLTLRMDMGNLEQNLLEVFETVQPKHFNVQDQDGKWCFLRLVPYRTMDNRIEGVVLSLVNDLGELASKQD